MVHLEVMVGQVGHEVQPCLVVAAPVVTVRQGLEVVTHPQAPASLPRVASPPEAPEVHQEAHAAGPSEVHEGDHWDHPEDRGAVAQARQAAQRADPRRHLAAACLEWLQEAVGHVVVRHVAWTLRAVHVAVLLVASVVHQVVWHQRAWVHPAVHQVV